MKRWILLLLLGAFGLGVFLGRSSGRGHGLPTQTKAVKENPVGPREVLSHEDPLPGFTSRLRQREVLAEGEYETHQAGEAVEGPGRGLGAPAEPDASMTDDCLHGVQQITYRDGVLSIFVHEDSLLREYQFRARPSFDAITPRSGRPRVFVDRCWLCEPSVVLEGGAVLRSPELAPAPYAALDASVALLSPRFRLFVRPELGTMDRQLRLGGRIVLR